MRRSVAIPLVLGLGIVVGLGAFGAARLLEASCGPFARTPCVRVLFLGNSYTYVNDLPTVFRDLARAGGQNVETGMVANGGETLAQHAASPDSLGAIRGSGWQFVVLQEQSEIPALATWQSQMVPAAETLVRNIGLWPPRRSCSKPGPTAMGCPTAGSTTRPCRSRSTRKMGRSAARSG